MWRLLFPSTDHWRPQIRSECTEGIRPCPYVGCRYNLYLDETGSTSIRIMFPHLEPWEMPPERSCALDITETGDHTLEEVGSFLNVTRERIRQIESVALQKIEALLAKKLDEEGKG